MAGNDDTDFERKTYYTNLPGWASAQVEEYIDETGLSNSKAVSKLVQRGLNEQTLIERIAQQLVTIPITTTAILLFVWISSILGEFIGWVSPADQILVQLYAMIIVPSCAAVAMCAFYALRTGKAKKLAMKLGFANITPEPDSD